MTHKRLLFVLLMSLLASCAGMPGAPANHGKVPGPPDWHNMVIERQTHAVDIKVGNSSPCYWKKDGKKGLAYPTIYGHCAQAVFSLADTLGNLTTDSLDLQLSIDGRSIFFDKF